MASNTSRLIEKLGSPDSSRKTRFPSAWAFSSRSRISTILPSEIWSSGWASTGDAVMRLLWLVWWDGGGVPCEKRPPDSVWRALVRLVVMRARLARPPVRDRLKADGKEARASDGHCDDVGTQRTCPTR